jgi:ferredoxin
MKIIINKSKCTMCGKCAEICPMNLIKKIGNKMVIDNSRCINCRMCLTVCKSDAIKFY